MCGNGVEADVWGSRWEPKGLVVKRQSIQTMTLVWREVRILVKRAPPEASFALIT
jgi:hypothetical protein